MPTITPLVDVADAVGIRRDTLRKRAERARKAGLDVVEIDGIGPVPFRVSGRNYLLTVPDDAAAAAVAPAENHLPAPMARTKNDQVDFDLQEYASTMQIAMLSLTWQMASLRRENEHLRNDLRSERDRHDALILALQEQAYNQGQAHAPQIIVQASPPTGIFARIKGLFFGE